jgi:hypothetical protein
VPGFAGIPVRWRAGESREGRVFASLEQDQVVLASAPCVACMTPLGFVEPVALLILGPGDDEEARVAHDAGRWYSAEALPLHAACAGMEMLEVNIT